MTKQLCLIILIMSAAQTILGMGLDDDFPVSHIQKTNPTPPTTPLHEQLKNVDPRIVNKLGHEFFKILKNEIITIDDAIQQGCAPVLVLQDNNTDKMIFAIKDYETGSYYLFREMIDDDDETIQNIFTQTDQSKAMCISINYAISKCFYKFTTPSKTCYVFSMLLAEINKKTALAIKRKIKKN